MEIKVITSQPDWDGWLTANNEYHQFPQAWAWGEILLAEGKQVERLAAVKDGSIIAQAQVVYNQLPFGWKYAFSPKGGTSQPAMIDYLKNKGCIFYRLEPRQELAADYSVIKTIDINPRATIRLDLDKSSDKLLGEMKPKTRYNIHLAEQKQLVIRDDKSLDDFLRLSQQTAKRDGFSLHPKEHYGHILASAVSYQLSAVYENKIIATNIFIVFGSAFTYLYGAFDYEHRSLMAPYLLQWQGIKLAKAKGYKFYDLFGIAPLNQSFCSGSGQAQFCSAHNAATNKYIYDQKHQYAGVTRFKLGFGGEICQDPGTYDLIFDKNRYSVYQSLRKIGRLIK